MVKLKNTEYTIPFHHFQIEDWLKNYTQHREAHDVQLIRKACELVESSKSEQRLNALQQGLRMAEMLLDLELDPDSIAAAIVYTSVQSGDLTLEAIHQHLGHPIEKLVRGVKEMDAVPILQSQTQANSAQIEKIRKMLLAMVDDIRVVLIKLVERTQLLRTAHLCDEKTRLSLSKEAFHIYAPLANRLGIGQIKWELEDFAFRYMNPDVYKEIALLLDEKRLARDRYISDVITELNALLVHAHVPQFSISGRSKHIYSIHRKMQRKNLEYDQIYDISAVRILVPTIEDCYSALGVVHNHFHPIFKEFDDYIATPKKNGYRSIHTAVIGPHGKNVEVQIRTYTMHQESELGVAAHWRYKEGGQQRSNYENKIAWLRQVLEWQKELSESQETAQLAPLDDRIYVLTPNGDIVELPQTATPLDFAYHVHSEVGHRCRGAKVNGAIVPLTSSLKTGDRVEILTARIANPSRDWLNAQLGYIKTSRARAKIQHWFKMQDFDKHIQEGKLLCEREFQRLHLPTPDYAKYAKKLHCRNEDELFAALGAGDIRITQFTHLLTTALAANKPALPPLTRQEWSTTQRSGIHIQGVGDLLTYTAKCCTPIPGDPIAGFITLGQGVAIHQKTCTNIIHMSQHHKERLIEVSWGHAEETRYPVHLLIQAQHELSVSKAITQIFSTEKIHVMAFQTEINKTQHQMNIHVTLEIHDRNTLERIMTRIKQLTHVIEVSR